MRLIATTLLATLASSLLITAVEAQSRRPLRVTVQPRSYLHPGNVVHVGTLQSYATIDRFSAPTTAAAYSFSEGMLPPRIGGGRNPFPAIDWAR